MNSKNWDIKSNIKSGDWTLFLDRDGVINRRIVDDYVKSWEEFEFLPGVIESFPILSKYFKHLFIVTNQQGVGKGLMTKDNVEAVHKEMKSAIEKAGGRIDAIYFCPALAAEQNPCRKPNIGMAHQAQADFADVDFTKSIMVGDSPSDIEFGINAGMKTVFIGNRDLKLPTNALFESLADFAQSLK